MENTTQITNEFNVWLNAYAKRVENTDEMFVLAEKLYTKQQLFEHFKDLKITEVHVLGYDNFFTIKLYRDTYYDMQECIDYVTKEIVETATVLRISHIGFCGSETILIENK